MLTFCLLHITILSTVALGSPHFKVASGQNFVPIPELPQGKPQISSLGEWVVLLQNTCPVAHKALEDKYQAHKKQANKNMWSQKIFKWVLEFTSPKNIYSPPNSRKN